VERNRKSILRRRLDMAFKDIVNTVKNEAGDAVEVTKLKAKISREKTSIKENYEKIGELIYNQFQNGGAGPDVDALISEITAARNRIEECNQEINKVKMN
jgi:hypothetical protein